MNRYFKTLCEKEKLSVKGNLSFSYHVFFPLGEHSAIFSNLKLLPSNSLTLFSSKIVDWEKIKETSLQLREREKIKLESV